MIRFQRYGYWRSTVLSIPQAVVRVVAMALCALALAAGPGALRAAAIGYTITDLGSLGGNHTLPAGLNNRGQVVGRSTTGIDVNAPVLGFLYDGTGMHDVGEIVGVPGAIAYGISDTGQLVGAAQRWGIPSAPSYAFLYDGAFHDLGTLPSGDMSAAVSINSRGHVAGRVFTRSMSNDTPIYTFFYDETGMHDLGKFPGFYHVYPRAMNNSDQIVGSLAQNGFTAPEHAFLWKEGVIHDLGTLGGEYSSAMAINDAGQVVGWSSFRKNGPQHAFLYDSAGMYDLGTLGGLNSLAGAINNLGEVAGIAETAESQNLSIRHLFLYHGGVMRDLHPMFLSPPTWGDFAAVVVAMNDRGQILLQGNVAGWSHAFLLTPTPAPELRISTGRVDFGYQPVGTTSAAQTVTLTNVGEVPLAVEGLSFGGPNPARFAISSDTGETAPGVASLLVPGASRTVQVTFNPLAANSYASALVIHDNDTHQGSVHRVPLSGMGGLPAVSLGPPGPFDFGSQIVGTTHDGATIAIGNIGHAPLVIHRVTLTGAAAAEFNVTELSEVTLAPGEDRTIVVRFTPAARGTRSATLGIESNAPGSPNQVALTGNGLAPLVSISPGSLDFGAQAVGTINNAQAVTIQNTGDAPLDIQSVRLAGADPGDFAIVGDGWTGSHLVPGQIATLNLRFTPTTAGDRSASLVVQDNAASASQSVALSGTGTAALATLSSSQLQFAAQLVGTTSVEKSITLTNTGSAPLTLHGIHFIGANINDFAATADLTGFVLAPGQSRLIPVRFTPTAAGSRTASLSVSDTAPDSPQIVDLTGTGTAPSVTFGVSQLDRPTRVSFGNQPVGTNSAGQTLTVTNGGTAPLTISSVKITGANAADFALSADSGGSILAPGKSRQFTLRFKPGTKGTRSASLTLSDNAAGSPHSIALQGVGLLVVPKTPTGLALKVASYQEIQLTWAPSSADATAYAIWRKVGSGEFQRYSGVAGNVTRFVDRHVSPKTTYTYRVRANGPGGISGWSNEAGGTTPAAPPPAAPTSLTVQALSVSQLELRWTDNSSDETSFAIWRKSGSGAWTRVGGVPTGVTRFVDRNLAASTSYSYEVRANGPGGVSTWSNQASGKTLPGTKSGPAAGA
jgi:probable HAF family extracellular repeat protein